MNPFLIIGAIVAGLALLARKKPDDATQPAAAVKLPTATSPGSVSVTVPQQTPITLQPPQVVQLPEVTIKGNPDNQSMSLSVDEQLLLQQGTDDAIFAEAIDSGHESFVAAAGLVLAGKGDARANQLSERILNWPQELQS